MKEQTNDLKYVKTTKGDLNGSNVYVAWLNRKQKYKIKWRLENLTTYRNSTSHLYAENAFMLITKHAGKYFSPCSLLFKTLKQL